MSGVKFCISINEVSKVPRIHVKSVYGSFKTTNLRLSLSDDVMFLKGKGLRVSGVVDITSIIFRHLYVAEILSVWIFVTSNRGLSMANDVRF